MRRNIHLTLHSIEDNHSSSHSIDPFDLRNDSRGFDRSSDCCDHQILIDLGFRTDTSDDSDADNNQLIQIHSSNGMD